MNLVRTSLLSAAGVILALGLTAAQAQEYGGGEAGGPPAAAPSGGEAGASDAMPAPREETGAETAKPDGKAGGKAGKASGPTEKMDAEKAGKAGKDEKAGAEMKDEKAGAGIRDEKAGAGMKDEKAGAESKDAMDKAATDKGEAATEDKAGASADTKAGAEDADGKTAKVDPEQINKAKTYFRQNRPRVKAIDRSEISVSVGFALPGTIVLYDLPPDTKPVRCNLEQFEARPFVESGRNGCCKVVSLWNFIDSDQGP
jgi:hypothetical protein